MLIEDLIFNMNIKIESLKNINNCIINEFCENYCTYNGSEAETYSRIKSFLFANSAIIETAENLLNDYQYVFDENEQ